MGLSCKHHCVTSLVAFILATGNGWKADSASAQTCSLPDGSVRPDPADGQSGVGTDPFLQWNGDCVELLTNGGFENQLTGWSTTATGGGAFVANNGTTNPPGPGQAFEFLACSGTWSALSIPSSGGTQTFFQDIMIPSGPMATITLQWDHRIRNQGPAFADPSQEFRVEIRSTSDIVLATAFSTNPGDTLLEDAESCSTHTFDLTAYIGQDIRIAFVVQSDVTYMNVMIDNVSVEVCDGSLGGMAAAVAAPQSEKLGVGDTWQGDLFRTVTVGPEANVSEPTPAQVYVGQADNAPLFSVQADSCPPVPFPTGFSTIDASQGVLLDQPPQIGYFFSATDGHSVEQTYTLPESSYDRFIFDFFIPMNVLAPGSFVNWNVFVSSGSLNNLVLLNEFTVVPGQTGPVHLESIQNVFGVPSGGGFDYKIRWAVTNNAASGSHTLGIASPVAGAVQISKQRFDLLLDTVNPPQKVLAQDLNDPFFDIPGTLLRNKAYYWQVITKDCCGDVPGPVWSFNTTCPDTPAPGNSSPFNEQSSVSITPVLTWNNDGCDTVLYGAATGTASVDDPSNLYRISPQNAGTSFIGAIGFNGVTGLAFSPIDGKLYGTCNDPTSSSHSLLIEIDPLTGAGTSIGRVNTGGSGQRRVCDISFRDDGTLFGYGENPHQLITLNLNTGAGTLVGSTGFVGVGNGLAFGPDGTLYATPGDITNDCLVTLNTANGAGTCIPGSEGNVPFFVNSMAYCFDSGAMLGVWNDNGTGRLQKINLNDGNDTSAGTFSTQGVDALAFFDDCNTTYDVFLSTTNPPTTLVGNDLPAPFFDVESEIGPLDPATTYFWRVVATDCCGTAEGEVWSFTTCALPKTPSNPSPLNDTLAQPIQMTLTWNGGPGAAALLVSEPQWLVVGPTSTNINQAAAALGATVSNTFNFATASLTGIDVLIFFEDSSGSFVRNAATTTKVTDFVSAGGGLYVESGGDFSALDYSWVPPAGQVASNGSTSENVGIAAPAHPLAAGVSDAGLDNWFNSSHGDFLATAGLTAVFRNDNTALPVTLAGNVGSGRVVYSNLDATFSHPGGGATEDLVLQNKLQFLRGSGLVEFSCDPVYDVFLDTVNPPVVLHCEDLAVTQCPTGTLMAGMTYYWQVVSKNSAGSVTGPVWKVTTDSAPVVSVETPTRNTNVKALTSIQVTFSKPVTGVSTNMKVNGGTAAFGGGGGAGPYTYNFAKPPEGNVDITLEAGSIAAAGSAVPFAGDAWTYSLDSIAPDIESESPTRGTSVKTLTSISVTFTEPVTGVVAADLVRNASPATNVTGSGAGPYAFTFAGQPAEGMVNVALGSGNIKDSHGNAFPGEGWSYEMDLTAPTVVTVSPTRDSAVGALTSIAVTFDDNVTGVDMADLTVSGTTVTNMTGAGAGPYTFSFVQPADGTINVALAAGGIQDEATNPFAGDSWTYDLEDAGVTFVPADRDADGDVDGVDFAKFAQCFNKAGNPPRTLGCSAADQDALDFDDDNDVDGADFAKFAACFNKAGNPPRTLGCPLN
jgi:hypothetical protein